MGADLKNRAAGEWLALAHIGKPERVSARRPVAKDNTDADTDCLAVIDACLSRHSHDPCNRIVSMCGLLSAGN
jgi:hypothetical protein